MENSRLGARARLAHGAARLRFSTKAQAAGAETVNLGKTSRRHPYAAIEHRVIDSAAFADLSFSARSLLIMMARQLTRENNGHLSASFTTARRYGFGSEHTLRNAIAELIAHGFVYRTRSHGANGAWAKYAVTWLPIKKRDGLFLSGFETCAWRAWEPAHEKSSRQKMPDQSSKKCSFSPENPAESAGFPPAKNADYELIPCSSAFLHPPDWRAAELARLGALGLAEHQCFQVPPTAHRPPNGRSGARGQGRGS